MVRPHNNPINILFACSEMTPWIKTGGLADVCASLPQALKHAGGNVYLVLPGYHSVMQTIPAPEFLTMVAVSYTHLTLPTILLV